jgi:hypothetical protein
MSRTAKKPPAKITILPDTCALELLSCDIPEQWLTEKALAARRHPEYGKRHAPLTKFRDILYHLPHHSMDVVLTDVIFEEFTNCLPDGTSNHPYGKRRMTDDEKDLKKIPRDQMGVYPWPTPHEEFVDPAVKGWWGVRIQPLAASRRILETMHEIHASDPPLARIMRAFNPRFQATYRSNYRDLRVEDRGEVSVSSYIQQYNPSKWVFLSEDEGARELCQYIDTDHPGVAVNVLKFLQEIEKKGLLREMGFKPSIKAEAIYTYISAERIKRNVARQRRDDEEAGPLIKAMKPGVPMEERGGFTMDTNTLRQMLDETLGAARLR